MSEFLFDISTSHHQHGEASYFINCSECNWNRIPAEHRLSLIIRKSIEAEVSSRNFPTISKAPVSTDRELHNEQHLAITSDDAVYPPESSKAEVLDIAIKSLKIISKNNKAKASLQRKATVTIEKRRVEGFNVLLLRKADEPNNRLLLIGDSIVGSICASGVDVLAMSGE